MNYYLFPWPLCRIQQVNSYGRTISVDLTFHRQDKSVSEKDCRGFSANQTLGHYHFQDQLLAYTADQDFILWVTGSLLQYLLPVYTIWLQSADV